MTGHEFQVAAAEILLPIADPHPDEKVGSSLISGFRSGIFQCFDIEPREPNRARLEVKINGVEFVLAASRDARPDEAVYDDMLRAARDLARQTKGDPT